MTLQLQLQLVIIIFPIFNTAHTYGECSRSHNVIKKEERNGYEAPLPPKKVRLSQYPFPDRVNSIPQPKNVGLKVRGVLETPVQS